MSSTTTLVQFDGISALRAADFPVTETVLFFIQVAFVVSIVMSTLGWLWQWRLPVYKHRNTPSIAVISATVSFAGLIVTLFLSTGSWLVICVLLLGGFFIIGLGSRQLIADHLDERSLRTLPWAYEHNSVIVRSLDKVSEIARGTIVSISANSVGIRSTDGTEDITYVPVHGLLRSMSVHQVGAGKSKSLQFPG